MKSFLTMLAILFLLSSCNGKNKNAETQTSDTIKTKTNSAEIKPVQTAVFDINTIPISDRLNGTLPYFKLPEGYTYTDPQQIYGEGKIKNYDKEYFLVNGKFYPYEGKTFKATIRLDDKVKDKEFNVLEIEKSFEETILNVGGVRVNNNDPQIPGELEKISQSDVDNGFMHSGVNAYQVQTYIIRKSDKLIWVQFTCMVNVASFTILETKKFENKMSIISAKEIEKQITDNGKAILYINFDVDKASLKPDGQSTVAEIVKYLQANSSVKLSIEGHTDNTGDAKHNKDLSLQRANTVMNELTAKQIKKDNLSVVGYGSEKPLVANDSEENKAKNRRVELVKK
jgi:OmpA-OmpF porin, OOP family